MNVVLNECRYECRPDVDAMWVVVGHVISPDASSKNQNSVNTDSVVFLAPGPLLTASYSPNIVIVSFQLCTLILKVINALLHSELQRNHLNI